MELRHNIHRVSHEIQAVGKQMGQTVAKTAQSFYQEGVVLAKKAKEVGSTALDRVRTSAPVKQIQAINLDKRQVVKAAALATATVVVGVATYYGLGQLQQTPGPNMPIPQIPVDPANITSIINSTTANTTSPFVPAINSTDINGSAITHFGPVSFDSDRPTNYTAETLVGRYSANPSYVQPFVAPPIVVEDVTIPVRISAGSALDLVAQPEINHEPSGLKVEVFTFESDEFKLIAKKQRGAEQPSEVKPQVSSVVQQTPKEMVKRESPEEIAKRARDVVLGAFPSPEVSIQVQQKLLNEKMAAAQKQAEEQEKLRAAEEQRLAKEEQQRIKEKCPFSSKVLENWGVTRKQCADSEPLRKVMSRNEMAACNRIFDLKAQTAENGAIFFKTPQGNVSPEEVLQWEQDTGRVTCGTQGIAPHGTPVGYVAENNTLGIERGKCYAQFVDGTTHDFVRLIGPDRAVFSVGAYPEVDHRGAGLVTDIYAHLGWRQGTMRSPDPREGNLGDVVVMQTEIPCEGPKSFKAAVDFALNHEYPYQTWPLPFMGTKNCMTVAEETLDIAAFREGAIDYPHPVKAVPLKELLASA